MRDISRRMILATPSAALASVADGRRVGTVKKIDGRADDTEAFEQALEEGRGGAVLIPPGLWKLRPDRIRLPESTLLQGFGRSSIIQRSAPGTLFRISGTSTEDRLSGCLLRDLVLDGNRQAGTLVATNHASDLIFDNIWSQFNFGIGLDAAEMWDSRFFNCTWDWCSGRDGSSPAVRLRDRAGEADPSRENCNAIDFMNCRWENFRDGAMWMERLGSASMSQIHLTNCKMEASLVRGPFLKLSENSRNVIIQNLYLCGNEFDAGWDTPVDLVEFSAFALAKLENVSVWLNAPVARTIVRATVGHNSCSIRDMWVGGNFHPTIAIVENIPPVLADVARVGYTGKSSGRVQVTLP